MRKLAVCVTFMNEKYRRQIDEAAAAAGFMAHYYDTQAALTPHIGDYEVIFGHPVPALLRQATGLRWLCSDFAGVEKYLDDAVWPHPDCLLSNGSGAYGPTISEHVIMVLLMLMRRMPEYAQVMQRRGWSNQLSVRSIRGSHFTLLGTGDIGTTFARKLRALGAASITGVNRSGRCPDGVYDRVVPISDLDTVLPDAHVLVMSLPSTPETVGILSRARLELLPRDAFVINVGRGSAIGQDALIEALNTERIAGAALDVMVPEPLPQDHPLWDAKNLVLTPHVAGNMSLGYTCDKAVDMFCEDLARYAAGEPLAHLVDRTRGY